MVFNGMVPPINGRRQAGPIASTRVYGEAEIIIPGSPFWPVILRLVVGADGKRIETVVSKPGYVVTSSAVKVDSSG